MGERRGRAAMSMLCIGAVLVSGCMEKDPGPARGLGAPSSQLQQQAYNEALEEVGMLVEDPNAPPLQQSINQANGKQLTEMAMRWDQATAVAKSIDPPADVKQQHQQLVASMQALGSWNHRIAKAAPNKRRTKRLAKRARQSPAAQSFSESVNGLASAGYYVLGPPPEEDPFGAAPPPAG